MTGSELEYDICLSFATEQRAYVDEVARLLRAEDVRVFYDSFETVPLWGADLTEYFERIYRQRSRYCVLFLSADYVAKAWTNLERRAALARAFADGGDYLLPVRCDDTSVPGVLETLGYVDARRTAPGQLLELILGKLRAASRGAARSSSATVLAVRPEGDTAGRSGGTPTELRAVVDTALAHARISPAEIWEAGWGDCVLTSLPAGTANATTVLTTLVPAVLSAFEGGAGRVRVGVDRAKLSPDGFVPLEEELDGLLRLMTSTAVGEVLTTAARADGVVVASEQVFDEAVRCGSAEIVPSAWRKVPGEVSAWVHVPGYPRPPVTPEPEDGGPRPAEPGTPSAAFYGDTVIGQVGNGTVHMRDRQ
ncbi:TIR domain-containing protein [Amycolatopsis cihanbeyliensis]|uniref:TIR domain-containing protein n=1 Tax=Amycolatopsis cihanbeyliensis TaxID=1128664 RepID=A0A542DI68_AMYCI|nr:TIR domain-containing protein [Amycolatopsis cihanbeyliensis]TQJ02792.1 TIR domain-containing protein [Amycolatopsis cihanbeyliensis]